MSQVVHICAPDGTRYERTFGDAATPEQILTALRRPEHARLCGRSRTVVKKDAVFGQDVPHADVDSPWVIDDPDTVICVGNVTDAGEFKEIRRLAGPPAKKEPESKATKTTDGK